MALLQISEPGMAPAPHQRKLAIGIDLGTTNSLVAAVRNSNAEVLPDSDGNFLLPSVVHYAADKTIVGKSAEKYSILDSANTVFSIKRLMGRTAANVLSLFNQSSYDFVTRNDGVPALKTSAGIKTPVEISADILKVLVERGEQTLGGNIQGAVITVPAYFDDAQRQATKDAATLAGINVLRLLNEPTAAAVAYGLDKQEMATIAVYDLGGGTFDISILRLEKGVFEVLATGGDSALGGDDVDHAIAAWVIGQLQLSELKPEHYRELITVSRLAKEALSKQKTSDLYVSFANKTVLLTQEKLTELIDSIIDKTLLACKNCIRDANIESKDIDEVVMVGGSTRLLDVRRKVKDFFGKELKVDIDPDQIVALGAAIQADILIGNKPDTDLLLLDVIPLSLGLETMGGLVEKIIHRNTIIPVGKAQEFTTFKDGQTALAIHVLQGERELVSDCRSLARFELRGIPPMVAGSARVRVTFQVDADGLLSVSAKEMTSGIESSIQVKPTYGLTDIQIAEMLRASYDHAVEDKEARALREQQIDAESLLGSLSTALQENGDVLLTEMEKNELIAGMGILRKAIMEADAPTLKAHIDKLSQASNFFAVRRMDEAIKKALAGHTLDELE